jgi:hypothetical protein
MAWICRAIVIDARPHDVWDALRDWGALHERLAPGFAVDTRLDGGDRIVTFFNDMVLRERLVALDDDARRLSWMIVDGPYSHHNASAQVFDAAESRTRFVWTTDLLPDGAAERTAAMMDRSLDAVKRTLEAGASAPAS